MNKILILLLALILCITFTACTAEPNEMKNQPREETEIAGFWMGLWHGIIAPISFIISLFSDKLNMYEVHNNGGWYNLGFLLGMSIVFGGGGRGSAGRRKRRS